MDAPAKNTPHDSFHTVGIGASAGGLEAFLELLSALPADTGMAFVLIQHLEPHHESQLAQILSNSTKMPVVQASEGQEVEPNHVYVIPPNTIMVIENRALRLAPRPSSGESYYPIDIFFESLASDQGPYAVGVVLSGSASDGAQGIRAIKARCGTTFAQDERSAKHGGMPHRAATSGAGDLVLPPNFRKMAVEVFQIFAQCAQMMSDEPPAQTTADRGLTAPSWRSARRARPEHRSP